jgi:uncharacterized protein involved in exopolysaccharide biosynthesis
MLAVVAVLLRAWRTVAAGPMVACVVVAALVLVQSRKYTATSSFIPQAMSQSDLSSLAGGLSAQLGLGTLNPANAFGSPDLYRKLLQTESVLSEMADSSLDLPSGSSRFVGTLAAYWRINGATPAVKRDRVVQRLKRVLAVDVDPRVQLVEVRATTTSPYVSQAIVRMALELVSAFNQERRQSQSAHEATFIGGRLEEARRELQSVEDSVARFVERNRDFKNAPFLTVQYERLQREVALRQAIFSALAQRYEQSRIEEVRDTPVITVVQQPVLPAWPDSRHLGLKLALAFLAGATVSTVLVLWRAHVDWSRNSGEEEDLAAFQQALGDLREQLRRPLRRLARRGVGSRRNMV